MGVRLTAGIGAAIGLVVSAGVLALLWFGVSGVLRIGRTDLMYVLWPSSLILVGGWHTTPLGMTITICSVATNCLMYAGIGVLLRWGVCAVANALSTP